MGLQVQVLNVWRHFETENLRGLEVDHQLVPGRRLHRQVGGFLALEDAIDIPGRPRSDHAC
jgi:hypothetical protein